MAKYDVTFSCGHIETVTLFGKDTDRKRKIEWFERECICSKCVEESRNAHHEVLHEALTAKGYTFNFNGTEKQNAYAEDILGDALMNILNSADNSDGDVWNGAARLFLAYICGEKKVDISSATSVIEAQNTITFYSKSMIDKTKKLVEQVGFDKALKQINETTEKAESMIPSSNPKPEKPEIVKDKKWNGRVYGKKGGYNVYLNGEKTMISDEQAAELEAYSKAVDSK